MLLLRSGQRTAAHLLQLAARGHLLGHQRRLQAVEEPLEPADKLGLSNAELRITRNLRLTQRQRNAFQLGAQIGGESVGQLSYGAGVNVTKPDPAAVVEGGGDHVITAKDNQPSLVIDIQAGLAYQDQAQRLQAAFSP